jgi:multimeric flavodoxin WrbA
MDGVRQGGEGTMKVMAINGGPRKKWNTGTMLEHAIHGAESKGAETRLVHLYDLNYRGCISCFSCKVRNGKSYGACAIKDDLTPIFSEIKTSDVLIMGSPVYFSDVTGQLRCFMERLLFPNLAYTNPRQSLFPGKVRTCMIYTMNAPEKTAEKLGYDSLFKSNELSMKMIFGHSEYILSYETYQFDDYSKVVSDGFDEEQRRRRREEVFPKDCQKAFEMGVRLVEQAS